MMLQCGFRAHSSYIYVHICAFMRSYGQRESGGRESVQMKPYGANLGRCMFSYPGAFFTQCSTNCSFGKVIRA